VSFQIPACADDSWMCIEHLSNARDIAASGRFEQRDERVLLSVEALERSGEGRPTRVPVLERERVLDIAQGGLGRGIARRALEPRAGLCVVRAKRLEPALRFPLQVLEGTPGRELPDHGNLPP